jgi:hypothetical protein
MLEFCNDIYAVPYQAKNYLTSFAIESYHVLRQQR